MKNISLALLILSTISIFQMGCDSTSPDNDEHFAYLELYWNNQIHYSETLTEKDHGLEKEVILPDNSLITISKIAHDAQNIPGDEEYWKFGCLASKLGYYSLIQVVSQNDTIRIYGDNGFSPVEPGLVCGLVYSKRFGNLPSVDLRVLNVSDSTIVDTITTNQHGEFAVDLAFGDYLVSFDTDIVEFNVENLYQDIELVNFDLCDKPNIYLYPEEETTMNVTIDFPEGGVVTVSEPKYSEGWKNITVTPEGKINGIHDFLFYESATSDFEIPEAGWVIAQTELEDFFVRNMKETGFVGREIDDFIEFWIPIFKENKYYEIYPLYKNQLDEKIVLNFSKQPDNMQRLIYTVKGRADNNLKLAEPNIPAFERKGFVVTEWGVIRKD